LKTCPNFCLPGCVVSMALHMLSRVLRIISNPHFGVVVALFAIGIVLHYPQQILSTSSPSLFSFLGLTRHALERIFFLLPISYAGFVFGLKAGLASLAVALIIMLPRVFLISPYLPDSLLETGGIIIIGGLVNLWFEGYRRERERRQQVLSKLEAAHQQLQSQVQVIESREKRLAAINAISTAIGQSLEIQDVLDIAADRVTEVTGLEVALIFLLNDESQELELKTCRGVSEDFIKGTKGLKVGEGFNGRVAQTGEPLLVEDASQDLRLTREVVKQEGIQATLIVPLKAKDKVVGTLSVGTRGSRQFLDEEVELLTTIGSQIGMAIENARLYKSERLAAQWALVSERRYREVFENASDAIWIHDLKGNIITTNKATEKLTGCSSEELLKMNVKDFLTEESLNLAGQIRQKLFSGEAMEQPYEQRLIRRDGTEAILKLTTNLITEDGKPKGFQHIARDVTTEKRMQDNLRFYLGQIVRAQEEERKRIARELHDDTAQELVALSRRLDSFTSTADHLSAKDLSSLEGLQQQVDKVLDGVRRFSQDLRPSVLDDLGLLPALEWLTSDLIQHFGIEIAMGILGSSRRFPLETELILFRVAQEALRNVWRHSEASRAWITVEFGDDKTVLTITDNGKGFELPERVEDLASTGKLGLAGMQERAQLINGKLTLQSEPGKGTTVAIEIPS